MSWAPPQFLWDVGGGFGDYNFQTTCAGYDVSTERKSVTTTTTSVILTVLPRPIPVEVYEGGSSTQYTGSCTIDATGPALYFFSFPWSASAGVTFSGHRTNGYGSYTFRTSCPGYPAAETIINIQITTTRIQLYITKPMIIIEVRDEYGDRNLIGVAAQIDMSSGTSTERYQWAPGRINQWSPAFYGSWLFQTSASGYRSDTSTYVVDSSISLIIVYLGRCGDGVCTDSETWDNCKNDCNSLYLEFLQYDKNTPVYGYTVNFFNVTPRYDGQWGPTRNQSVVSVRTRVAVPASNVIIESTFQKNEITYIQVNATGFILFYWTVDFRHVDALKGEQFYLRGHLSPNFLAETADYRVVNTWRATDVLPTPYGPTDINLHLFFPQGVCDVNHPNVTVSGAVKCKYIADNKEAAGPASYDFNMFSGEIMTLWNGKPPRNPLYVTNQANRYLKDSDSYIVFYGRTSDASAGKQLGEVTLHNATEQAKARGQVVTNAHDIWRIADVSVSQPASGPLNVTSVAFFGTSTIDQFTQTMSWNCQLNTQSFCVNFVVPYSDQSKK